MVAERMADGLNDAGLLFPGFMYLHTLFLTRGRLESTWTVLRLFGEQQQQQQGGGGSVYQIGLQQQQHYASSSTWTVLRLFGEQQRRVVHGKLSSSNSSSSRCDQVLQQRCCMGATEKHCLGDPWYA
jgi:hypothetical protein